VDGNQNRVKLSANEVVELCTRGMGQLAMANDNDVAGNHLRAKSQGRRALDFYTIAREQVGRVRIRIYVHAGPAILNKQVFTAGGVKRDGSFNRYRVRFS